MILLAQKTCDQSVKSVLGHSQNGADASRSVLLSALDAVAKLFDNRICERLVD